MHTASFPANIVFFLKLAQALVNFLLLRGGIARNRGGPPENSTLEDSGRDHLGSRTRCTRCTSLHAPRRLGSRSSPAAGPVTDCPVPPERASILVRRVSPHPTSLARLRSLARMWRTHLRQRLCGRLLHRGTHSFGAVSEHWRQRSERLGH